MLPHRSGCAAQDIGRAGCEDRLGDFAASSGSSLKAESRWTQERNADHHGSEHRRIAVPTNPRPRRIVSDQDFFDLVGRHCDEYSRTFPQR